MNIRILLYACCVLSICSTSAFAEHPIEVQRHAANGEYFKALLAYDALPSRRVTTPSRIAAARSAWALGLSDRAIKEFEVTLRDPGLDAKTKTEVLLSRGIIEFQEQRYQVANLYAEKAIDRLADLPGPLRSRAWLLWGDGLYGLESYGAAAEKYEHASKEADEKAQPDIQYRLGLCNRKLGKLTEAQENFQQLSLDHPRAPQAIRHLAELALESNRFTDAAFWLQKGRESFADEFLDSWVDFALVRVAVSEDDAEKVRALRKEASEKYPPSDHWLTLLHAEAEEYEWRSVSEGKK